MSKVSHAFKGTDLFVFAGCLLVVGGVAMLLRNNWNPGANSSTSAAAFVPQTTAGTLVKKETPAFTKACGKDANAYYALIESSKCTLLVVNGTKADPLVGKKVTATGVMNDDAFYASGLELQK